MLCVGKRRKKRLLTIEDIAEMLSVSETTVRKLVKDKELAAPRKVAGRSARWFPEDVEDYLTKLRLQKPDDYSDNAEPRQGTPRRARQRSDQGGQTAS
jgi:excisionase family DNA binding protein